ncbi:DivIVA domain-containing protein [Micromonospora sp. DT233]|uniref:DivIVA domain-containing protein n=1 Tax=Micromonospora sp. DT233 TaxID=3393432 RepID=UPI003CF37725
MNVEQGSGSVRHDDTARALAAVEARRFRGGDWLPVDEVADVARSADARISLLNGEVQRLRRENEGLVRQVEMLRHGALPSAAPQGPDPMVVELAVRAQDEANRAIAEASEESAEIIADARRQAEEIVAEAHRRAGSVAGSPSAPVGGRSEDLQRQVRELQARHEVLLAVVATAQQHLGQWQAYLAAQGDQLRADAAAAGAASQQLRRAVGG